MPKKYRFYNPSFPFNTKYVRSVDPCRQIDIFLARHKDDKTYRIYL